MPRAKKPSLDEYVRRLFAPVDAALATVPRRQAAEGLPAINVSPEEGKLIAVLLAAVRARRVLEIGTLGGYSGIWIARALPPDGRLTTIEIDPRHAAVARRSFVEAGVLDRVDLREGPAREILPSLEPGFDAVFIDADKQSQVFYFQESMRLLRVGGLLLCDNAYLDGRVVRARDQKPDVEAVREFNRLAATDPRLVATIVGVRDGLVVGVKVSS